MRRFFGPLAWGLGAGLLLLTVNYSLLRHVHSASELTPHWERGYELSSSIKGGEFRDWLSE